jgi:drug/metabolite transporter (DMT)-like permease
MPSVFAAAWRWFFSRPYLLLSLTALFWGGNIVMGRAFAPDLPPVTLSAIRWTGAFCLALPLALPHLKADWPVIRASAGTLLILAATGVGAYNTVSYLGLRYTEALNGLLMQSAGPILTVLWSLVLFRDRPSPGQIAGILISLTGVTVIVTRGDLTALGTVRLNPGDVIMVVAVLMYAFYTAYLRKRPRIRPLSFLAVTTGIGAALQWPLVPLERMAGWLPDFTPAAIVAIGYIIVFPAFLAYLFFNRGVELVGAIRAAPFFHLVPVFGSALAIVFLGERPALYHLVGYALVLGGVAAASRR